MEKLSLSSDAQSTVKNGTLIYTYDFRSETKKHQIKCIGCLDQRAEAPHISNSSSFCIARLFVVSCGIVETKLMKEFAFFAFDRRSEMMTVPIRCGRCVRGWFPFWVVCWCLWCSSIARSDNTPCELRKINEFFILSLLESHTLNAKMEFGNNKLIFLLLAIRISVRSHPYNRFNPISRFMK